MQGRFTSPDSLLSSGRTENPQTWNRFNYVLGNPLKLFDPSGFFEYVAGTSGDDIKRINKAYDQLLKARNKYKQGSKEYEAINRSLTALGAPGQKNGVLVADDNSIKTPGATYTSYTTDANDKVNGSESCNPNECLL